MRITRRTLLTQATGGAAVAAGAIFGFPTILRAADPVTITYAKAAGGVSAVLDEYMSAKRYDLKHGVNIKTINTYVSIPSYYADLTAGTFEMGIGAWDTFYRMFAKGVPVRIATSVTSGVLINFVAKKNGLASVADLKGKTMSAISGSGALAMFRTMVNKTAGIDLEKDVTLQNVQNPAAALTLLIAGNVDGALSWEPYVSTFIGKDDQLKPIYNVGEEYQKATGKILPYFSIVVRNEALARDPDIGRRVAGAIAECTDGIMSNPEEAFALAAPKAKLDASVLNSAFKNGRFNFVGRSMAEEDGRSMLKAAFATFSAAQGIKGDLDDKFFIS